MNRMAMVAGVGVAIVAARATAKDAVPPKLTLTPTADDVAGVFLPQPANPQRNYQLLPFDEDWRWLKDGANDHDLFDPIKYIPLGSPDLTLSVGGSARLRYEYKINPAFGATNATSPTKNDDYWLERAFIHTDLRYRDYVRLFVEGEFAYIDGFRRNPPPTPTPSNDDDLHQAFLDLMPLNYKHDGFGLTLRLGRQELLFDRQKLVGPLDWSNARRTFDGFALLTQFEQYKAELFWVRPVVVQPKYFDQSDSQTNFAGAYLTHPTFDKDNNYSLFTYYLNRARDTKTNFSVLGTEFNPDQQAGDTDRVTLGGRVWGKVWSNWDYDVEGGFQVGRLAGNDIRAEYFSGEAGYTFADVVAKPRLSLGYDYASGDRSPTDGKSNTFDQLFPTGHLFLGYIDLVGRQNIDAGNVTATITPTPDLKLWATWHYFCLASANDALYNAAGQTLRYSASGSAGTQVGNELDLTGSYQLGRHTTFLAGYGVFLPGAFINHTGKSETVQMVFASVEFKF